MTETISLRVRIAARLPALVAVLVFGVFVILFWRDRPAYDALLRASGTLPVELSGTALRQGGQPFFDTQFVLAQLQCWRRGIDVYVVNPCDPIGRLQDYSPLWLRLGFIPATPDHVVPFGLALDVAFLASLFLLPLPRPRLADCAALSLTMVSTATIFAMERGNTDLLMFAMCAVAGRLLSRPLPSRLAGYAVILAAAALKFYPLVALAVVLRERMRVLLAVAAAAAVAVIAFAWRYGAETQRALANAAGGYFGDLWGAAGLPFGVAEIVTRALPDVMARHPAVRGMVGHVVPLVLLALLLIIAAALAIRVATQADVMDAFAALPTPTRTFLVIGSALTTGCFLAHPNIGYRAVVVVLEMPGLLALARDAATTRWRALLWANVVTTVFLVWNPPGIFSSFSSLGWVLRQYVWWAHVTVSMAVLLRFGRDSAGWHWLRGAARCVHGLA